NKKSKQQRISKALERFLENWRTNEMIGEDIAWLTMAARRLPISKPLTAELEKQLLAAAQEKAAQNEGAQNNAARTTGKDDLTKILPPILNSSTRQAWLLIALLDEKAPKFDTSKSARSIAEKLVKRLELDGCRNSWGNNARAGLCLRALCRYLELHLQEAVKGRARLSISGNKKFDETTFESGKPKRYLTGPLGPPGSNPVNELQLTPGLNYVLKAKVRKVPSLHQPTDTRFAVRRSFHASGTNSRVWRQSDGTWHCTRGSSVIMRLTIVPRKPQQFLATICPHPAGLKADKPDEELINMSPPHWEKGAYLEGYNRWPQRIVVRKDRLELYSRAVTRLFYCFEYPYKAAFAGSFLVPPAEIHGVFDRSICATTGGDRLVVEE
ncbi:MAG: hypothetical protein K8F91_06485, partial [Candidatus Obscuribacterales bacterium]|nr:hypothetical protein [Candidatus Obscuribacterales bacterium]